MGGKYAIMNTGSRMLFFLSWILLVLFSAGRVQGQEIQLTGSARSTVAVGETFTLTYTLNAQGAGFRGPNIQGFEVLSGPNTSTSSSIRSINGRTSMTITYTYTYLLQATREGSFDIPAASVSVDRKTFTSNTLNIKVVKNAGGSSGASGHGSGGTQGGR
ncbi:MAG TPA: BatD family protein, partial [Bacteroidales bacterium]|nr:BatD family protein [Bacteroidales bacterium]